MSATAAPPSERDAQGRFAPGNSGGPGNPFARQVAALRQALLNALTPDKMMEIAQALIAKAAEGNVQAAKLLFSYALGKPAETVNPDRLDVEEWEGYKEQSGIMQEAPKLVNAFEPRLPLTLARVMRPGLTDIAFEKLGAVLDDPSKLHEVFPGLGGSPPSPNGVQPGKRPSPNGKQRRAEPSANGTKRPPAPSANGLDGLPQPIDPAEEEWLRYLGLADASPNGK